MNHRIAPVALIAVLAASFACDKPGVTEQQKEDKAAEQARNAAAEAERQTLNAQASAEQTISAARVDFEKTRENYLHDRRIELSDLDKKIADLDTKVRTSMDKKHGDALAHLTAIRAKRDAYVRHMEALYTASASSWDGATAGLDKEWDALKTAVDNAG